jgi:hypothetical protein
LAQKSGLRNNDSITGGRLPSHSVPLTAAHFPPASALMRSTS